MTARNRRRPTTPRRAGLSGFIGDVAGQVLDPFQGFAFALFIGGHRPIAFDHLLRDHVRPRKIVEEPADPAPADDAVQPSSTSSSTVMVIFLDISKLLTRILYVSLCLVDLAERSFARRLAEEPRRDDSLVVP